MRSVDEKTPSDLLNKLDEIFKEQDTVPVRRGKRKSVDKTAAIGGERILLKRNPCLHLNSRGGQTKCAAQIECIPDLNCSIILKTTGYSRILSDTNWKQKPKPLIAKCLVKAGIQNTFSLL